MRKLILIVSLFLSTSNLFAQWNLITDRVAEFEIAGDSIVATAGSSTSVVQLKVSTDRGATWSDQFSPPWTGDPANVLENIFFANGRFYATARNSSTGFFRTTSSLTEWESCENGFEVEPDAGNRKPDIHSAFALNDTLYAYTGVAPNDRKIYMSVDAGDNWTLQSSGNLHYLLVTGHQSGLLGVGNSGVFRSEDKGVTFDQILSFSNSGSLRNFIAKGDTLITLWAPSQFVYEIEYSTDFGENWTSIDATSVYNHYTDNIYFYNGFIYVQSFAVEGGGGFRINITDESVAPLGLPEYLFANVQQRITTPVFYRAQGDTLYAASFDGSNRNFHERTLSDVGTSTEDDLISSISFTLNQNFPNPFNPSTSIQFSISKASDVTLTVHNMLGQEIETLISGFRNAGTYQVSFDASFLPSGVYQYQLKAGNRIFTRQMTLIK